MSLWSKTIEASIDWLDVRLSKRKYYQRLFTCLFSDALLGSFKEPELVKQLRNKAHVVSNLHNALSEDSRRITRVIYKYLGPDAFVRLFLAKGEASGFLEKDEYEEDGDLAEAYRFVFGKRT